MAEWDAFECIIRPVILYSDKLGKDLMNTLIRPPIARVIPRQTDTDDQMIQLWLKRHDSRNTRRAYQHSAALFLALVGKPLAQVTVGDLQA